MRHMPCLHREDGNTLIELAMVLPVFFTVVFGFIYFAMVMFQLGNIAYATRTAMRYACLHSTANAQPTSTRNISDIIAPMLLPYPTNTAVTTLNYSAGNVVGGTATVTVTLYFQTGFSIHNTASGVIIQ